VSRITGNHLIHFLSRIIQLLKAYYHRAPVANEITLHLQPSPLRVFKVLFFQPMVLDLTPSTSQLPKQNTKQTLML